MAVEQRRIQKDLKILSNASKDINIDQIKIGNAIQLLKRENNDYEAINLNIYLSVKEQQAFGERIPNGYLKEKIIFKDECQIIWLASKDQTTYAVKQFPKTLLKDETMIDQEQNYQKTAKTQTEFMEDLDDYWIICKLEGDFTNFAQSLCFIKGENIMGNNRVYSVKHLEFYKAMAFDISLLAQFIYKVAAQLDNFTNLNVVHSNLQPKNIFINMSLAKLQSVKILDFTHSQKFDENFKIQENSSEY